MWRNVRCHTDRDTHLTIQKDVWQSRWQNNRLLLCTIEVIAEVDRILIDICQKRRTNLVHASLSVTRCRRLITIHRTEVTLTFYERIALFPRLRQVNHCIINRRVTVWVVFTHHFTNDTCGFDCSMWRLPAVLLHREENTTMHWLQTIAHIRQGTVNNHRHRVAQEAIFHHVLDREFLDTIVATLCDETTDFYFIDCFVEFFFVDNFTFDRSRTVGLIYTLIVSTIWNVPNFTVINVGAVSDFSKFVFFIFLWHLSSPP